MQSLFSFLLFGLIFLPFQPSKSEIEKEILTVKWEVLNLTAKQESMQDAMSEAQQDLLGRMERHFDDLQLKLNESEAKIQQLEQKLEHELFKSGKTLLHLQMVHSKFNKLIS